MPIDRIQQQIVVGDVVNVPCVVTACTNTSAPTVTLTTKYAGFDGNTDSVGTLDAIQAVKDQMVAKT